MTHDWICRSIADSVINEQVPELLAAIAQAEGHRYNMPEKVRDLRAMARQEIDRIARRESWDDVADGCQELLLVLAKVKAYYTDKKNRTTNHDRHAAREIVRNANRAAHEIYRTAMFELTRTRTTEWQRTARSA